MRKVSCITAMMALALSACAASSSDEYYGEVKEIRETTVRPKVIGGLRDEERARDHVLAVRIGKGDRYGLCSGSLIAPNLVLTALHCVAKGVTHGVACDSKGQSHNGDHVEDPYSADQLSVFLGTAPDFSKDPVARGKEIVAPASKILCNTDIALIVLDRSISGVTPLAVRFKNTPVTGEKIKSIGYGINNYDQKSGVRYVKDDVVVLGHGAGVTDSGTSLASREFETGRSICQGDSGGPAISVETGAVVGVVSRGGSCEDDYGHIYTSTVGFDELFQRAFKVAGDAAVAEKNDSQGPQAGDGGCSCSAAKTNSPGQAVLFLAIAFGFIAARSRHRR